jgi:hypothetical protein
MDNTTLLTDCGLGHNLKLTVSETIIEKVFFYIYELFSSSVILVRKFLIVHPNTVCLSELRFRSN